MRRLFAFTAAVLLFVTAPLGADTLLLDRFRDYLESLRVQGGIPGLSVAIIGTNDIIWERAFGQQDVERSIAARTDTPYHFDGLTEIVTASLVLQCAEEGRLSLEDTIGTFQPDSPDANLTIRQVLTHTAGPPENLTYAYRPDRLEPLAAALQTCRDNSFRTTVAGLLERLAMVDSLAGPDIVHPVASVDSLEVATTRLEFERYVGVLTRLATPYAVDAKGRAVASQYSTATLTTTGGLISTVDDFAKFDLALKGGLLIRGDTLTAAWQAPVGRTGKKLPHGMGWFVQNYNGELIAWQFGATDVSSSLVLTAPARGLTVVLVANSSGLAKLFPLAAGDVTVSPFARVFLGLFVR